MKIHSKNYCYYYYYVCVCRNMNTVQKSPVYNGKEAVDPFTSSSSSFFFLLLCIIFAQHRQSSSSSSKNRRQKMKQNFNEQNVFYSLFFSFFSRLLFCSVVCFFSLFVLSVTFARQFWRPTYCCTQFFACRNVAKCARFRNRQTDRTKISIKKLQQ